MGRVRTRVPQLISGISGALPKDLQLVGTVPPWNQNKPADGRHCLFRVNLGCLPAFCHALVDHANAKRDLPCCSPPCSKELLANSPTHPQSSIGWLVVLVLLLGLGHLLVWSGNARRGESGNRLSLHWLHRPLEGRNAHVLLRVLRVHMLWRDLMRVHLLHTHLRTAVWCLRLSVLLLQWVTALRSWRQMPMTCN